MELQKEVKINISSFKTRIPIFVPKKDSWRILKLTRIPWFLKCAYEKIQPSVESLLQFKTTNLNFLHYCGTVRASQFLYFPFAQWNGLNVKKSFMWLSKGLQWTTSYGFNFSELLSLYALNLMATTIYWVLRWTHFFHISMSIL